MMASGEMAADKSRTGTKIDIFSAIFNVKKIITVLLELCNDYILTYGSKRKRITSLQDNDYAH